MVKVGNNLTCVTGYQMLVNSYISGHFQVHNNHVLIAMLGN